MPGKVFALAGISAGLATIMKGPLGIAVPLLFALLAPVGRSDLERPCGQEWGGLLAGLAAGVAAWVVPAYLAGMNLTVISNSRPRWDALPWDLSSETGSRRGLTAMPYQQKIKSPSC